MAHLAGDSADEKQFLAASWPALGKWDDDCGVAKGPALAFAVGHECSGFVESFVGLNQKRGLTTCFTGQSCGHFQQMGSLMPVAPLGPVGAPTWSAAMMSATYR